MKVFCQSSEAHQNSRYFCSSYESDRTVSLHTAERRAVVGVEALTAGAALSKRTLNNRPAPHSRRHQLISSSRNNAAGAEATDASSTMKKRSKYRRF
uniref:Uncharacterized protein n=1 Tax=Steinernema glaseri TaxID=37863 RepID=A0A1I8AKE0_9BILA